MLLILYAVVLLIFWISALRIKAKRFPNVDPEALIAWRNKRLRNYRLYAWLLLIWVFLNFGSAYLHVEAIKQPTQMIHTLFQVYIWLLIIYVIAIYLYALANCIKMIKWGKNIGVYRS